MRRVTVALAGNPNVGKSSVFNVLTGLRQHTGNWAGKTVATARGRFRIGRQEYDLVDLPGIYSLAARSEEERIARDYLASDEEKIVVVVCDATALQRSMHLVLQCMTLTRSIIVCVNLMDEAARRGICVDLARLECLLGVPVVGSSARSRHGLRALKAALQNGLPSGPSPLADMSPQAIARKSEEICGAAIVRSAERGKPAGGIDAFLTGSLSGTVLMLAMLAALLWLTIQGANLVSDWLSSALMPVTGWLRDLLSAAPWWLSGAVVDGLWRVLSWVVCVMLPPMAFFFPMFTLLEDAGVLPRIAFAADRPFQLCGSCGKQALTCSMGLGCNAAGVTGCRIIESPRERLLAVLTNALTPCSGRFPMLAALTMLFFEDGAFPAAVLLSWMAMSVVFTFFATRFLSVCILKGPSTPLVMEIPPFRVPQFGRTVVRSVMDRTVFVLGRAASVAAPAGVAIWLLANLPAGESNLVTTAASALDPVGRLMGLDGVILLGFLLAVPANEIVLPLIMMGYLSTGVLPEISSLDSLHAVLVHHGWTSETAFCTGVFAIAHWPCSTTTLTIYRETHSLLWTALAVALPTAMGAGTCILIHTILSIVM